MKSSSLGIFFFFFSGLFAAGSGLPPLPPFAGFDLDKFYLHARNCKICVIQNELYHFEEVPSGAFLSFALHFCPFVIVGSD